VRGLRPAGRQSALNRKDRDMPIISSFFGIYVRMYFADHSPPHIHVEYQGHEALIAIADGSLMDGELPRRALTLVRH
jgi:hypothetical protein